MKRGKDRQFRAIKRRQRLDGALTPTMPARGGTMRDLPGGFAGRSARPSRPSTSTAERQLLLAGFTNVQAHPTPGRARPVWFEAKHDGDDVVVLRQAANRWHVFFKFNGTASGSTPEAALSGGLGDVIDTDPQMRKYLDMVLSAPDHLVREYDGLHSASQQAFHERGGSA